MKGAEFMFKQPKQEVRADVTKSSPTIEFRAILLCLFVTLLGLLLMLVLFRFDILPKKGVPIATVLAGVLGGFMYHLVRSGRLWAR